VHLKVANSMAASGPISRSDLVGTGKAISVLSDINGVRNKRSYLVWPQLPVFKACFLVRPDLSANFNTPMKTQ